MKNITSSCMEMRSGQGQSFEGRLVFNNNGSNKQLAGTPEWTSLHTLCKQMSTLPRAVQIDSELCPLLFCVSFYTLPCIRLALNSSLQHFSLKAIHPPSLPLPTLCLLLENAGFLFFSAVLYSSASLAVSSFLQMLSWFHVVHTPKFL